MKIKLSSIAYARSGDKGAHSNVGIIFKNKLLYDWAVVNLTEDLIHDHFKHTVNGKVIRYCLDNLDALNFVLYDSLGGGGSESLLNDAQGKTYGQHLLNLTIDLPKRLEKYINE
tara:strand:+ start:695 stop:1036 length:342 start_codon:yes stop_codon:yes gene_type:complete